MDLLTKIAEEYFATKRIEEALRIAAGLIVIAPFSHRGYKLRGSLLARLGRNLEARDLYRRAVERNPLDVECVMELGRQQAIMGDSTQGLLDLRRSALLAEAQKNHDLFARATAHLSAFEAKAAIERDPVRYLASLRARR